MPISWMDTLQPTGGGSDVSPRLVRGKDVDITSAASELTNGNLANADIFLVDDNAGGVQSSTKKILASSMKTYFQTGLQTTLTFGGSSGNALKSEEALSANDILLMGSSHVKGRTYSELKADLSLEIGTDVLAQQTIGIANDNLVEIDGADIASGEYARFTSNGLESRTIAEIKSDLSLAKADVGLGNVTNDAQLPLAGGTITGDTTLTDNTKIIFGDAGEHIAGDGTDLTITSSGDIILDADGGDVTIQDSGTSTPRLALKNTSDQYGTPPVLSFEVNPSNDVGQDGDDIGRIDFKSDDDGGNVTTYTQILGEISDASGGTEDGKLSFKVALNSTLTTALEIKNSSSANTSEITLGNDSSSGVIFSGTTSFGGTLTLNDQRLVDAQRIGFNDGGYITEFIDTDDMSGATSTKASSSESIKAYVDNTIRDIKSSGFNYSYTAGTKVYIPLGSSTGESSSTSGGNDYRHFVVPFDGYLDQVVFRSEEACGSTIVGFHKSSTGVEVPSSTASATVTVNMTADDTAFKFDFTSSNTFSAGDIIAISFDPTNDANDTNATIILVYDGSQGV